MKIEFKERGLNDHYDQLEGDDMFSKAVNDKLSSYWAKNGNEMPSMLAMFEVLADLYNEIKTPQDKQ